MLNGRVKFYRYRRHGRCLRPGFRFDSQICSACANRNGIKTACVSSKTRFIGRTPKTRTRLNVLVSGFDLLVGLPSCENSYGAEFRCRRTRNFRRTAAAFVRPRRHTRARTPLSRARLDAVCRVTRLRNIQVEPFTYRTLVNISELRLNRNYNKDYHG